MKENTFTLPLLAEGLGEQKKMAAVRRQYWIPQAHSL